MTRVVLSIGSNLGARLARLQSVVDGLGDAVLEVSPVYETDPWGRLDQAPFLNAVLIADDPASDGQDWLRRAQEFEREAGRVRGERWGPRTLDVDLISCYAPAEDHPAGEAEVKHWTRLNLPPDTRAPVPWSADKVSAAASDAARCKDSSVSASVTVTAYGPLAAASRAIVPVMAPVLGLMVRPGGRPVAA